ncbi:MAG: hypothetical protein R3E89_18215 [Thiolinea sp.]
MKKYYQRLLLVLLLPTSAAWLSGCSVAPASSVYSTTQAGTLQDVKFGTVISVRNIMIEHNSSETGQVAGGIIGGVAGSEVGEGKGKIVGSVAGAVAGGAIGGIIDRAIQAKPGYEITIQLQDGRTVAVAQLADEPFRPGDSVKIITAANGKSRVTH